MNARIRNLNNPPPGGEYFAFVNGERVSDRYWIGLRPKIVHLLEKYGLEGSPEQIAAESMCPYMPDWFCSGVSAHKVVRINEAKEVAKEFFRRDCVTFDEVSRRLQICASCPKHDHSLCLTCTGLLRWILVSFGNRRIAVPEDKLSGTCECARTFTSVAATVAYEDGEPEWEGVPENCWRRK